MLKCIAYNLLNSVQNQSLSPSLSLLETISILWMKKLRHRRLSHLPKVPELRIPRASFADCSQDTSQRPILLLSPHALTWPVAFQPADPFCISVLSQFCKFPTLVPCSQYPAECFLLHCSLMQGVLRSLPGFFPAPCVSLSPQYRPRLHSALKFFVLSLVGCLLPHAWTTHTNTHASFLCTQHTSDPQFTIVPFCAPHLSLSASRPLSWHSCLALLTF